MNKKSYEKLIEEDLAWLIGLPDSLEKTHIKVVLKDSIARIYPEKHTVKIDRRGGNHMGKITYSEIESGSIQVYLGGRYTGLIKRLHSGRFHYWPKGKKSLSSPSDIRDNVDKVKKIIEG